MIVGVPRESFPGERRVALVPAAIPNLAKAGLEVVVEAGAGAGAGYPDADYAAKGAKIAADRAEVFRAADIVTQILCYGSHHGDGVERVRQGHQGGMEKGRNAAYDFKSDKRGQHENVEAGKEIQLHDFATSLASSGKGGSEKNSRTRALTTSPPRVNIVSRTISSSIFSCSLPSFTRCSRKALTFRAYI